MGKSSVSACAVAVEFDGNTVTAQVTLDGSPVDGEVQWWNATPYRDAPGGAAQMVYKNPSTFALSAIRRNPPKRFEVTARVMVDGDYIYSKTVEVEIP
jgi:hypothetical protein